MRAIFIQSYGGREVMQLGILPDPTVKAGEVLVRVKAAGVNPVDWKIREGLLKDRMPSEFPIILGWDAAGVIEAVGEAVEELKVGDEVFAYCRKEKIRDGAYAEFIALEEKHLAFKPANLSFEEAAAVPLAALTAYQCLFESIQLKKGETILIHAGAGGVGGFAIQLAQNVGAIVITTASSAKHEYVTELGADSVIHYQKNDFVSAILARYPQGIDAVLDTVGGDVQKRSADVLKKGGRLTSILALDENYLKGKEVKIGYVFVRPEPKQLNQIKEMIEAGKVKVHLSAVLPLEKASTAHEMIESGHTQGKIVLKLC